MVQFFETASMKLARIMTKADYFSNKVENYLKIDNNLNLWDKNKSNESSKVVLKIDIIQNSNIPLLQI